jgi:hypothetical protein
MKGGMKNMNLSNLLRKENTVCFNKPVKVSVRNDASNTELFCLNCYKQALISIRGSTFAVASSLAS